MSPRPDSFTITPRGEFSLAEAAGFGFGPRTPDPDGDRIRLAFVGDDMRSSAAALVTAGEGGGLAVEIAGDIDAASARAQVERILSLDHDGEEWGRVAAADEKLAGLAEARPGARPVCFGSPYEAAAWSVISLRRGRTQGQNLRTRIAEALGERLELAGETQLVFPTPERLLDVDDSLQGLEAERVRRLHGVARAALDGELDAERLRSLDRDEALESIGRIRGLGPYYAGLVLVRGSGVADALPVKEKKLIAATARLYGRERLGEAGLAQIAAERWRPFRTWAAVLVRTSSDQELF